MTPVKLGMLAVCIFDFLLFVRLGFYTIRVAQVDRRTGQNQRHLNYALIVAVLVLFEGHLEYYLRMK